jgi:hypothetical protein
MGMPKGHEQFVVATQRSNLTVRTGPGTNYLVKNSLAMGTVVESIERKKGADGGIWHLLLGGGWVSGRYLKPVGAPTSRSTEGEVTEAPTRGSLPAMPPVFHRQRGFVNSSSLFEQINDGVESLLEIAESWAEEEYQYSWRLVIAMHAVVLAESVGVHEWWDWDDAQDPWLPRDCLSTYVQRHSFSHDLVERIGRAIARHHDFRELDRVVAARVEPELGNWRAPIPERRLLALVQQAISEEYRAVAGHGFDNELQAVVGDVHELRVDSVSVRTWPNPTGRMPRNGVSWSAHVNVRDVYDFQNNVRGALLLAVRETLALLLMAGKYEEFFTTYAAFAAASTISKAALVAYYFHACERAGFFRPIPWTARVRLREGDVPNLVF